MPVVMAEDHIPLVAVDEVGPQSPTTSSGRYQMRSAALLSVALALVGVTQYPATSPSKTSSSQPAGGFTVLSATGRSCTDFVGVQLVQEDADKTSLWPHCVDKWSHDCRSSGCCNDPGMKCFAKDHTWAACLETCTPASQKKTLNETWSCAAIEPPQPHNSDSCRQSCQDSEDCQQVVFNAEGAGSCTASKTANSKVAWASDNFNTSLCGTLDEMASNDMTDIVATVEGQLPFQIEWPLVTCSWGGEDCSETKCCNDYICDKNYDNCYGYQCFQKTEYFSGCAAAAEEGWDGTQLGGPREHRVIPPAAAQVAVQGSSLYCFTVVTWGVPSPKPFWNSEKEIAENWQSKGLHVLQCDASDIIDGIETPRAEWGSFSNIDMFMEIWKKVDEIGKWKEHDWTVKVDSDAVFLPHRLKDHLFNLRTPKGSRVYIENTWFKFKFMGAIEIMTKEAAKIFIERGHECIRGEHAGGEDSFTKGCLDGLGVDHQTDDQILRDKYAGQKGPCTDGWHVAYHYMKKTHDWSVCYNEVMCGDPCFDGPCCDGAIEVPHDPGWA